MNFRRIFKFYKIFYYLYQFLRIKFKIFYLKSKKPHPDLGSEDWLCKTEIEMGGYVSGLQINKISDYDPRANNLFSHKGMIGGDRMIHHNYAKIYAKYLNPFIMKKSNLVILECGILNGTGISIWSKLFPQAKIIGLDIDLKYTMNNLNFLKSKGAFKYSDPILLEFDQFNPNTKELEKILVNEKIDIIIDDGYHSDMTILNTFKSLKPFFNNEFVYFCEDNKTVSKLLNAKFKDFYVKKYGSLTVIQNK